MKKVLVCLALVLGPVSSAFAGNGPVGFSTFQISWSGGAAAATAVPTMSTYATLLLAVLLALVVFRSLRSRGLLVRAMAPLATFGLAASFIVMTEHPIAGVTIPDIGASSCSGSETYTATFPFETPPCFVNTCGSPVTVSYTFIEGVTAFGAPITEESCTLVYYCEDEGPIETNPATEGAVIPSDGFPYGTAACEEILDVE